MSRQPGLSCPGSALLQRFLNQQLRPEDQHMVEQHVETCSECQDELERLTAAEDQAWPVPPITVELAADRPDPAPPVREERWPQVPGYTILKELGRGGKGIVYLARDTRLKRLVALKMMLTGTPDVQERVRFRTEAEAMARLVHPNIVPIHEVGEHEGRPFFVMEYLAGGSLSDWLDTEPQPSEVAAALVETLARAMHHAHQRGVIHRDLKPGNILLQGINHGCTRIDTDKEQEQAPAGAAAPDQASAGQAPSSICVHPCSSVVKITDFGVAKFLDGDDGQVTLTGSVALGTPPYMAPEQAAGKSGDIGTHTDVYALGAILYRMLTGHPPFEGGSPLEIIARVRSETDLVTPPRKRRPGIPRDLELICLKCLEKDPKRRYGSAEELADELGRFRKGEPLRETRPVGSAEKLWRWYRRNPALGTVSAVAAAAVVAVAVVSTSLLILKANALRESNRFAASVARDWGLSRCEQGEVALGLLWLGRSLELAPPDAHDLQHTIRTNLAAWSRLLHPWKAPPFVHPGPVYALAFSPDGKTVLTGCEDGIARLWDVATGTEIRRYEGRSDALRAVAFSPDGQTILTGGLDATARLWDAVTGQELRRLPGHSNAVRAAAFSPDGETFLTAGQDGIARLWKQTTGELVREFLGHSGAICAVAYNPDGLTVLTGSEDGTARLWGIDSGKEIGRLEGHTGPVRAVAFSAAGQMVLTGSADKTARLWETEGARQLGPQLKHEAEVNAVAFAPDGRSILTAGLTHTAQFWDLATRQPLGLPLHHANNIYAAAVSRDGQAVATGGLDGVVQVWEAASGTEVNRTLIHPHGVWAAAFSPGGKVLLTGTGVNRGVGRVSIHEGEVHLWEAETGSLLATPFRKNFWFNTVAVSPDGRKAVAGGRNNHALLWDVATGKELHRLIGHEDWVMAAAFGPDGEVVVTGSTDRTARLWSARTGEEIRCLRPASAVDAVAFSPDGRAVLTAGGDHCAYLWDTATGNKLRQFQGHSGPVYSVAFSPDGRRVLTGSKDRTARLWDAATGERLGPPLPHPDEVHAVAFRPDGAAVVTGCNDGATRLWDVATRRHLGPPLRHKHHVTAVAFRPSDGKTILTASTDGTVRLWEAPEPLQGSAEQIALWIRVITAMELDAGGAHWELDGPTWMGYRQQLRDGNRPPPS